MKIKNLMALIMIFPMAYCSSPTEIDDSLLAFPTINSIIISNTCKSTLYLFLVEQEAAAVLNWAPHFQGPKVPSDQTISIPFDEIFCNNGSLGAGKKVIIYFWDGSNKSKPKIYSKIVQL